VQGLNVKLSIIGPELGAQDPAGPHIVHMAQRLTRLGVGVQVYVPGVSMSLPEDVASSVTVIEQEDLNSLEVSDFVQADVCVYYLPGSEPWLPEIKRIQHAVVILDCHGPIAGDDAHWLHYADLCLAASAEIHAALIHQHGCLPGRIYTLSPEHPQYWEVLAQFMEQAATGRLKQADEGDAPSPTPLPAPRSPTSLAALQAMLTVVCKRADVALRDYTVRSRLPLVGPFVAWVRRNLTSHLREPYLDLIVERQVAFNQDVATWMEQVLRHLSQINERLGRLEAPGEREERQEDDLNDI